MKTKEYTTEIWALMFQVDGNKLGITTRTPQGKKKRFWVQMSSTMTKAIEKEIQKVLDHEAYLKTLTPQQLQEYYRGL